MLSACLGLIFEIALVDEAYVEFEVDLVILKFIKIWKMAMLDHAEIEIGFFIYNNWSLAVNLTTTYIRYHALLCWLLSWRNLKSKLIDILLQVDFGAVDFC